MSRIARIVGVDYPHHIVQRGNNKQTVFFDDEDRKFYLHLLKRYSSKCHSTVHAYCLMKNHVHLLITPHRRSSLAKTMQKLSLRYTQWINEKYARTGRLWECRFYSCVVDKEAYLWTVCRYIERNPVRAKLTKVPIEYQWSSTQFGISLNQPDNFIEPIWEDNFEKENYLNFLNHPDDGEQVERIRRFTLKGLPLGDGCFVQHIKRTLGIEVITRPRGRPKKSGHIPFLVGRRR